MARRSLLHSQRRDCITGSADVEIGRLHDVVCAALKGCYHSAARRSPVHINLRVGDVFCRIPYSVETPHVVGDCERASYDDTWKSLFIDTLASSPLMFALNWDIIIYYGSTYIIKSFVCAYMWSWETFCINLTRLCEFFVASSCFLDFVSTAPIKRS